MILVQSKLWFWIVLCTCYTIQHNPTSIKEELQHNPKGCEDWKNKGFFLFFHILFYIESWSLWALFVFVLRCKTYFFYFLYVFCFVLFCFFLFFFVFFVFFGVFWCFLILFLIFVLRVLNWCFWCFLMFFWYFFLILTWFIPFFDYNRITIRRAKTFAMWCVPYDKGRIESKRYNQT